MSKMLKRFLLSEESYYTLLIAALLFAVIFSIIRDQDRMTRWADLQQQKIHALSNLSTLNQPSSLSACYFFLDNCFKVVNDEMKPDKASNKPR